MMMMMMMMMMVGCEGYASLGQSKKGQWWAQLANPYSSRKMAVKTVCV